MQYKLLKIEVFHWIKYLTDKFLTMAKIKIKHTRSSINRPKDQKRTIEALGFRKLNQVIEKEATPQIMGMIKKVSHLLEIID